MPTYGKRFCEGIPVHDYQRVFERMPPVREPPEDETLPFGPRNLSIYARSFSPVIVGSSGGYGYGFFDDTFGVREEVRLYWDVTATLSRIGRDGSVGRTIGSETENLGVVRSRDIEEIDLWLDTPPGPALYRYDLEFRDQRSGAVLGRYATYLRVVKPSFRPRIAVARKTIQPGQIAYARVENHGTEWLYFGLSYGVQRYERGAWRPAPESSNGVVPAIGLGMGSGGSGWCMRYRVPPRTAPGWYRFVKGLGRDLRGGGVYTAAFRAAG